MLISDEKAELDVFSKSLSNQHPHLVAGRKAGRSSERWDREGLVRDKPARAFNQSAVAFVERKSHFLPASLSVRLITCFFSSEIAISFSPCFRHAKA